MAILTFIFGLQPTAPPIDVMLMIAAVISAASCMQAAGGLDYLVKLAERILRRNPAHITILAPLVTYTFTFLAGTPAYTEYGSSFWFESTRALAATMQPVPTTALSRIVAPMPMRQSFSMIAPWITAL